MFNKVTFVCIIAVCAQIEGHVNFPPKGPSSYVSLPAQTNGGGKEVDHVPEKTGAVEKTAKNTNSKVNETKSTAKRKSSKFHIRSRKDDNNESPKEVDNYPLLHENKSEAEKILKKLLTYGEDKNEENSPKVYANVENESEKVYYRDYENDQEKIEGREETFGKKSEKIPYGDKVKQKNEKDYKRGQDKYRHTEIIGDNEATKQFVNKYLRKQGRKYQQEQQDKDYEDISTQPIQIKKVIKPPLPKPTEKAPVQKPLRYHQYRKKQEQDEEQAVPPQVTEYVYQSHQDELEKEILKQASGLYKNHEKAEHFLPFSPQKETEEIIVKKVPKYYHKKPQEGPKQRPVLSHNYEEPQEVEHQTKYEKPVEPTEHYPKYHKYRRPSQEQPEVLHEIPKYQKPQEQTELPPPETSKYRRPLLEQPPEVPVETPKYRRPQEQQEIIQETPKYQRPAQEQAEIIQETPKFSYRKPQHILRESINQQQPVEEELETTRTPYRRPQEHSEQHTERPYQEPPPNPTPRKPAYRRPQRPTTTATPPESEEQPKINQQQHFSKTPFEPIVPVPQLNNTENLQQNERYQQHNQQYKQEVQDYGGETITLEQKKKHYHFVNHNKNQSVPPSHSYVYVNDDTTNNDEVYFKDIVNLDDTNQQSKNDDKKSNQEIFGFNNAHQIQDSDFFNVVENTIDPKKESEQNVQLNQQNNVELQLNNANDFVYKEPIILQSDDGYYIGYKEINKKPVNLRTQSRKVRPQNAQSQRNGQQSNGGIQTVGPTQITYQFDDNINVIYKLPHDNQHVYITNDESLSNNQVPVEPTKMKIQITKPGGEVIYKIPELDQGYIAANMNKPKILVKNKKQTVGEAVYDYPQINHQNYPQLYSVEKVNQKNVVGKLNGPEQRPEIDVIYEIPIAEQHLLTSAILNSQEPKRVVRPQKTRPVVAYRQPQDQEETTNQPHNKQYSYSTQPPQRQSPETYNNQQEEETDSITQKYQQAEVNTEPNLNDYTVKFEDETYRPIPIQDYQNPDIYDIDDKYPTIRDEPGTIHNYQQNSHINNHHYKNLPEQDNINRTNVQDKAIQNERFKEGQKYIPQEFNRPTNSSEQYYAPPKYQIVDEYKSRPQYKERNEQPKPPVEVVYKENDDKATLDEEQNQPKQKYKLPNKITEYLQGTYNFHENPKLQLNEEHEEDSNADEVTTRASQQQKHPTRTTEISINGHTAGNFGEDFFHLPSKEISTEHVLILPVADDNAHHLHRPQRPEKKYPNKVHQEYHQKQIPEHPNHGEPKQEHPAAKPSLKPDHQSKNSHKFNNGEERYRQKQTENRGKHNLYTHVHNKHKSEQKEPSSSERPHKNTVNTNSNGEKNVRYETKEPTKHTFELKEPKHNYRGHYGAHNKHNQEDKRQNHQNPSLPTQEPQQQTVHHPGHVTHETQNYFHKPVDELKFGFGDALASETPKIHGHTDIPIILNDDSKNYFVLYDDDNLQTTQRHLPFAGHELNLGPQQFNPQPNNLPQFLDHSGSVSGGLITNSHFQTPKYDGRLLNFDVSRRQHHVS